MDIKRTILIVALAIVSYVMVLKWNQDYGQAALPTQNVAASNTAPSLPDTTSGTNAASSDDIPRAASDTSAPAEAPVAASKDLIQIKTDVLQLAIDPQGGDIAQLTLRFIHVARIIRTFRSSCSITVTSGPIWPRAA